MKQLKMIPLSLYIHLPFCERKCLYCDFVSYENGDHDVYIEKLCKEIQDFKIDKNNYIIQTVYIGGGTPSLLGPTLIAKVLNTIREKFTVAPDPEISIECNPNSITQEKLLMYKQSGINRISIGVQSFSDKTLKVLGRVHTSKQAKDAINLATKHFANISIDLMYSIPNASLFIKLPKIIRKCKHVSAYCLTSDRFEKVPDEQSIKQQLSLEKQLAKQGFKKYEVSNFSKTGYECKHNIVYWQCGNWLGFGESAASHFNEPWTNDDKIMLGLRMTKGIPLDILAGKQKQLDLLVNQGLLQIKDGNVACTSRGFLLLNQVILKLVSD